MMKTVARLNFNAVLAVGLGLLSAGVLLPLVPQSAIAQTTDPLPGLGSSDLDSNPMNPGEGGFSMFELLHRAQQGTIRNRDEFLRDQQESLGSQAADFREMQRRALEQQQSGAVNPEAPTQPQTP